jgi:dihydroxyacetone kinase-like protein
MKKLINDADRILSESLDGFAAAHADIVSLGAEQKIHPPARLRRGKVALVCGGQPLHAGWVGRGTGCRCPGQVFRRRLPTRWSRRSRRWKPAAGASSSKNYEGDVMNFQMAATSPARKSRRS